MGRDARKGIFGGNQDTRKGLGVFEPDVERRIELAHQLLLKQKSFVFGARGERHHAGGLGDHTGNARAVLGACIGENAPFEPLGLTNVKDLSCGIKHAINARLFWQGLGKGLDGGCAALSHELDIGDTGGLLEMGRSFLLWGKSPVFFCGYAGQEIYPQFMLNCPFLCQGV